MSNHLRTALAALALAAGGQLAAPTLVPTEARAQSGAAQTADGETEGATEDAAKDAAQILEQYDGSTVIATVGAREVTLSELIAARRELPPQSQNQPDEVLYDGLLNQLTAIEAYAQAGLDDDLDEDPALLAELEKIKRELVARNFFEKTLEEARAAIDDETAKARYDADIAKIETPEEVRARHILVKTEEEANAVKAEADGGADFAELAKEKSTGPSAPRGGDLGFFTAERMVPEFSAAAFALQAGEISEPVQTAFGWHVIKLEERRRQQPPSFEQVKERLVEALARERAQETLDAVRAERVQEAEARPPFAAIRDDALAPAAE
ncbi:MAG: peptidyl-prolyl cis-trans isomerase [Pseudomonadota bacterium]